LAAWLYDNREDLQKRLSQFALLFTLPILTFAGWLKFLWDQWVKVGEGFWIKPKTSSILVDTIRIIFRGSKDYPSKGMLYNLSLVLIFMGTSYWVAKIADDKNKGFPKRSGLSLVFLFSIPFLIAYVVSSFWVPVYHERFLIPILPLFIIWIAYSLFKLCKLDKSLSYFVFAIATAYVLFGIQSAEEIISRTTKPAINHGVKQVLTQAQYGDVIVPESNLNFLEVKYYVKKFREDIPVYAYLPNGEIPFYIGSVLFEKKEIINEYPKNRKVWVITQDGGHYLKN